MLFDVVGFLSLGKNEIQYGPHDPFHQAALKFSIVADHVGVVFNESLVPFRSCFWLKPTFPLAVSSARS